jgi:hypothetical protein
VSDFWPTSAQAVANLFHSSTALRQLIENPDNLIDSIPAARAVAPKRRLHVKLHHANQQCGPLSLKLKANRAWHEYLL